MNEKLLTIDEVAEYLGVHRDTVYSLVRSGRLPAMQLGGRKAGWRISQEDVRAFISEAKSRASDATADRDGLDDFDRQQEEEREAFRKTQDADREQFLERQAGPRQLYQVKNDR